MKEGTAPEFICDHMLGSLARWLRLLGYDTVYPGPIDDREAAAKAYDEGRVLLTRDKDLAARVKGAFYVGSDDLDEQMGAVTARFHLEISNPLSRCSVCNAEIVEVDREKVRDLVPPKVFEIQSKFWRCPSCSRVYWRGTHWEEMTGRIKRLKNHNPS